MKSPIETNKYEIIWHLVDASLAGTLVMGGTFLGGGDPSLTSFIAASVVALTVFVTKFKNYWETQQREYASRFLFL